MCRIGCCFKKRQKGKLVMKNLFVKGSNLNMPGVLKKQICGEKILVDMNRLIQNECGVLGLYARWSRGEN